MTWRDYHESTRHSPESLRRTGHTLDWANMPDPFRHYEGVPVLDLPADPAAPEVTAMDVLRDVGAAAPACDGPAFLSRLLFYSAAISASKRVASTGDRYALRVNPSSGNLHPTEFHFITRGVARWPDGLYHYRPSSHMAEQRALGNFQIGLPGTSAPIVFVLTSIAWREAWKYRSRAYRYCLLDMGHAWQALALAARSIGCDSFALGHFPDDELAESCRLHGDEWPMLIVALQGASISLREPDHDNLEWFNGRANRLSTEEISYPLIERIHAATKVTGGLIASSGTRPIERGLPGPAWSSRGFGEVVRTRRSALDFQGGAGSMTLAQLSAVLEAASMPLTADFSMTSFVQLYLYVHRVEGLECGVYRHGPEHGRLERIKSGDQRVVAAGLSLAQDLAGNACVAFSMIADIERATRVHGERGYRYVHFEAGSIGHKLYVAAEALGFSATGIGAFFDEAVHEYLGISPDEGQVVYHFAIGHAVPDDRIEDGA